MGKVLDRILAKRGLTVFDIPKNTSLGKITRRRGVSDSRELQRILALPERDWASDPDLPELVQLLTEDLKTPQGKQVLRPIQAIALKEGYELNGALVQANVGEGKAQPIDEPVLTPEGWKRIGNVRTGDFLIGSNGKPILVTGIFPQGLQPVAKLTFTDGSWTKSTYDHLWTFRNDAKKYWTKSLSEWVNKGLHRIPYGHKWFLPTISPVEYQKAGLPLDPYTLGAFLGDGCFRTKTPTFTSMDPDIVDRLVIPVPAYLRETKSTTCGRATQYAITCGKGNRGPNPVIAALKFLGLWGHDSLSKFIPEPYKRAPIEQRLALLQGLFDTDGTPNRRSVQYSSSSSQLFQDVREVVESLGGTCSFGLKKTTHADHYRGDIKLPRNMVPFLCTRKAIDVSKRHRTPYRALASVEYVGKAECVCISVDAPDSLYLTRHHIPTHNTIPSFLIARILEAKRPLLILPAKLIPKTEFEREKLKVHWNLPNHLQIISYEKLGVVSGATFLESYRPDLIVADEVHRLKNLKAARTRRMRRYMEDNPGTAFFALSGTVMRKSLRDFHHIQQWTHPPELRPLPDNWSELQDWSDALDARVKRRLAPGALLKFCRPGEDQDIRGVRQAFGRRLASTPGVIVSQGKGVPCSLTVEAKIYQDYSPELENAVHILNSKWVLPDEWQLTDAPVKWSSLRQLTRGFYYRPNPRPPRAYLDARRDWGSFVRECLHRIDSGYDSELQVRKAFPDNVYLKVWDGIKNTFKYNQETIWLDYSFLYDCAVWLEKERGILWVEHVEFGNELSEVTGYPYFGAKGMTRNGVHISACKGGPIICSLGSIGEGHNLQDRWYKNRITCPRGSGADNEQTIGRTHRELQEADTVEVQIDITCKEDFAAITQARAEQESSGDTFNNSAGKLLICDYISPSVLEVALMKGPRWDLYR